MKKWMITGLILAVALVVPAVSRAHEGHAHKVMGTIWSVDGKNLMVKTTDGKTVMVMLDAKTKIAQGKNKVDASALKVEERIVAEGPEDKEMITATTVQLGTASPAAAKVGGDLNVGRRATAVRHDSNPHTQASSLLYTAPSVTPRNPAVCPSMATNRMC